MCVKFGWAEADITPTVKIALCGQFYERVTDEVETPISVTALAIESGGEQAVFCSCDLEGVNESLVRRSRQKLNAPGLDPRNVIINAVHTHNSYTIANPDVDRKKLRDSVEYFKSRIPQGCEYIPEDSAPDQMDPLNVLEFLSGRIAEAVSSAWNNRKEGLYANGFGRAAVGMCRRVCYADGTAKMWGDTDAAFFTELEGGNDSGIELLFTYDMQRNLTGVVANIACPSQVMEQRTVISSDYWGKVKLLLREKYGEAVCLLALCAPAGDQCPRDLVRWVEPETPIKDPNVIRESPKARRADPSMFDVKGTWTIGRRIMNEIDFALSDVTEYNASAVLRHKVLDLKLPLRRVTESDKTGAEAKIKAFFRGKTSVNYIDTAELNICAGILERFDMQKERIMVHTEVHVLRLGDIAFATSPFELFLDFGNRIRARSAAKQTFLVQLCQDALGYLPTEKAEKHGHYSAYVASGLVGHAGGDLLVANTLDEIANLFDETQEEEI
ncbi:MAG: hypothetical protein ACOX17_09250 [Christensenellales bacterium]|jgi:hypothetical protein